MILGTGIDMIEIKRIEKLAEKQPKFIERILTSAERIKYHELNGRRKYEYLSGRFAAKEAFAKAAGTGIGKEYSWLDIEVISEKSGKPAIQANFSGEIHLSISHTKEFAIAQVILESSSC